MQASQVVNEVSRKAKTAMDNIPGSARMEGGLTKTIEQQTAKIPSLAFLMIGLGSIALSAGLRAAGRGTAANFVGLWTPTILIMGLYNKLVKVEGSDRASI